jgi:predicted nucleic acid-binding protein
MMRVLFDTNVLLDVVGHREPFHEAALAVWSLVEAGKIDGVISAISFNNVYYIVRKFNGQEAAIAAVRAIRRQFRVVALGATIVDDALKSGIADLEDAIQHASAVRVGADCIVSRDSKGFTAGTIAVLAPEILAPTVIALPGADEPDLG